MDGSRTNVELNQHVGCIRYQSNQSCKEDKSVLQVRGPHLQYECKHDSNNKFQNKPATEKTQKHSHTDNFHNNKTSNHMFPTGTLSFQASQIVRSGKDVLVSMAAMKHILGK